MKPKKLNWRNGIAETPFGPYSIATTKLWDDQERRVLRFCWTWKIGEYLSEAEAQAAAQADFERRVRECFEGGEENESLHTDGLTESDLIGGDN